MVPGVRLITDPEEIEAPGYEPPIPDNWGIVSLMIGWRVWAGDGFMFMLVPQDDGTAEVHTRIKPGTSMHRVVRYGREVIAREFEAGYRLVGHTPKIYPQIYRFALACGMVLVEETEDEWFTTAVRRSA